MNMGGRILVVDDDADVREGITIALADEGYEVVQAKNGADALAVLERLGSAGAPSIILLDMTMPVMDGATFRARQLADARIAPIPVIFCSADGRATLPGPPVFPLRKPFDVDQLYALVARIANSVANDERAMTK